ncbi:uncharacterized protein N7484_002057 [Penicillium longicatenatum]|uniref:uncharacterized protein n=1 Tax=Penicillium longicatenatum TaxID=1561947 RepID=UPI002546C5C6|nr:uncharacterized protein N7484_002057 [Penicillium longicatenatum]KAJ5658408.1 hypothetical protein N7484_002057 [Penicillium longicatenatum]
MNDLLSDAHGPPRKRMRKGTRSCMECRRRKIRCTYDSDRCEICNECRFRGSKCFDQEHGSDDPSTGPGSGPSERYSLRERVAYLETVVQDLAKRLDETNASISKSAQTTSGNLTPVSTEPDRLGPSSEKIENAPVMQLFDNYLVSRRDDPSSNDQFMGAKDTSDKARAVRLELISLFPSDEDIKKVLAQCSHLWCMWEEDVSALHKVFAARYDTPETLVAPADLGKALVCLCISMLQSPPEFDFNTLQLPMDVQVFASRCCEAVDRLVVRDDDFSATLPGIECHLLLSKFHMNEGRLRKAWLINRRAIDLAHLAGMHLSTRTPQPSDSLFERRLKIWCSLATSDRSISLILGLPYVISDAFYLPQVERRLKSAESAAEQYMLRIGVITGHMIDRNQNPTEMCLETTLKLDQELMDAWNAMPNTYLGSERGSNESREQYLERIPLQFMPKVLRALLHLPFMLKYPHDPRFRYCHKTAIQSAREAQIFYKIIRSAARSNMCKVIDFMAFTMGMLLVVHLYGYSEEWPDHSKEEDEQDWALIGELVGILRQAASESGGSVAAESAHILGEMYKCRLDQQKGDWDLAAHCKITVPYFGTITVGAGAKFAGMRKKGQNPAVPSPGLSTSSSQRTPGQLYTPPMSDPDGVMTVPNNNTNGHTPVADSAGCHSNQPLPTNDDSSHNAFTGLEGNAFSALFDDIGQYIFPNTTNVDLGLDQGWNLNWFDGNVLPQ